MKEFEAFAVGLHHPVLDPVVDHLHEVAGAGLAEVRPAIRRRERVEDRLRNCHRVGGTADHHAVAVLESPDPSRDADVEEAQTFGRVFFGTLHRIAEVAVPAIHQHVARGGVARELVQGMIGRLARRDHRPEHARWLELFHHVLDRARAHRAVPDRFLHRLGATVARDDAMTTAREPRDHVPAHAP